MKKQSKQKKKPTDIEALENNVNVLSFIQNDFNEIVGRETKINNEASKRHLTTEQEVLDEKEKSEIILNELIISCEEKKRKLEDYVKVANEIIKKNNELIEKRKKEISSLIMEKDLDINLLQRKIDFAKSIHDDLNSAVVNVFKNLKLFLSYRTQGKINIGEFSETASGNKRDETMCCDEQHSKNSISKEPCADIEHWDKKLCEENKMKLNESINSYKANLQSIKRMIEESIKLENKLLHLDENEHDNNISKAHGNNNSDVFQTVPDKTNGEKREDNEIGNIPIDKELQEPTALHEKDTYKESAKPGRDITDMIFAGEQITSRKEKNDLNKDSDEDTSRSETETEIKTDKEEEEEEDSEEEDYDEEDSEEEDYEEEDYDEEDYDEEEVESDEGKYESDKSECENDVTESEKEDDESDESEREDDESEKKSDVSKADSVDSNKNSPNDGVYKRNKRIGRRDEEVVKDVQEDTSIDSSEEETNEDSSDEEIGEREGVDEKETNSATTNAQSNKERKTKKEKKTVSEAENLKSKRNQYMLQGNTALLFDESGNEDCSYLAYYERRLKNL